MSKWIEEKNQLKSEKWKVKREKNIQHSKNPKIQISNNPEPKPRTQ
jgi:hypothetical protein